MKSESPICLMLLGVLKLTIRKFHQLFIKQNA